MDYPRRLIAHLPILKLPLAIVSHLAGCCAALLVFTLCSSSLAHAQPLPISPAALVQASAPANPAADGCEHEAPEIQRAALLQLRLQQLGARRTAGFWLLGWGIASAIGGGIVAGIGHDSTRWLAFGITTASFGVVNALLAPGLLDLSGAHERAVREELRNPHADLAAMREAELVGNLEAGQTFALNAGLDVFYIATGLFVYALGRAQRPRVGWEEGMGLGFAVQGLPLLVFDIANWIAANGRAEAYRGLRF